MILDITIRSMLCPLHRASHTIASIWLKVTMKITAARLLSSNSVSGARLVKLLSMAAIFSISTFVSSQWMCRAVQCGDQGNVACVRACVRLNLPRKFVGSLDYTETLQDSKVIGKGIHLNFLCYEMIVSCKFLKVCRVEVLSLGPPSELAECTLAA